MLEWLERFFDKYFLGSGTRSIRPESEVAEVIKDGAYILDVRLGLEAKKGMVPGAKNIDMLFLRRHLDELPRDRTIVTYCKTGGRAGKARDILARQRLHGSQRRRLRDGPEDRGEEPICGWLVGRRCSRGDRGRLGRRRRPKPQAAKLRERRTGSRCEQSHSYQLRINGTASDNVRAAFDDLDLYEFPVRPSSAPVAG